MLTRAGASSSDATPTGTDLYVTAQPTGNVVIDGSLEVNGVIGGSSTLDISGNIATLASISAGGNIRATGNLITDGASVIKSGLALNSFYPQTWTGQGTLVAGTATISNLPFSGVTYVHATRRTVGGSPSAGVLEVSSITAGPAPTGGFTINSLNASGAVLTTDTGSFQWFAIKAVSQP